MALGLSDCLQSLHALIDQNDFSRNREQIEIIVEDIKLTCLQDLPDITHACSLLFDKETGIISFLKKTLTVEELQNGKTSALLLLSDVLQKFGSKVVPYAVDIKDTCVSLYSRDRHAKVKKAAIPVIIKILEQTASTPTAEELVIDDLITKFFNELAKPVSKLQPTVRAGIYHLLGVLAELHPDMIADYSERLAGVYVSALKVELMSKTKEPEMSIVAGCLEGLSCFMLNFTQSAEEGSKHAYEIFKYLRMVINADIDYSRYEAIKAALKLLVRHAGQMRQFMIDEYKWMYEQLQKWSHHRNKEVVHLGVAAMEAFTKEVSEALVDRAKQGHKEGAIFKFFLLNFNKIMKNPNSSSKEVSMAIKGYGLLAAPCRIFLSEVDTQFMFNEMVSQCEHQFLGKLEEIEDKLMSLPSYLISLANIISQIDSVSLPNSLVLEKLMVLLMEHIPKVNQSQQFYCVKSILILLLCLKRKPTVFQQILTSVVYQSLIRTCSHPVVAETSQTDENLDEYGIKKISYKDYISLWATLLGSCQMKVTTQDLSAEDFTLAERDELTHSIYNEIMTAILKILNKLDLEATTSEDSDKADAQSEVSGDKETLSADPIFGLVAKRPKDQLILINIVDFSRDLLVHHQRHRFKNWVYTFTYSAIVLSTKHPLVSGFYKLLCTVMTVVCKLKYFKDVVTKTSQSSRLSDSMDVDEPETQENQFEKVQTYQLIKKFTKEVLVRMKQYRDELLAACLSLTLALPEEIIQDQMANIVPAIQTTFIMGLSYLPLANIGLDALQYWSDNLPASLIEPYYAEILPYLDAYLRTDDKGSDMTVEPAVLVPSKKAEVKSKVSVRLIKGKPAADQNSETQLTSLKLRILQYLGSLGGQHISHALLAKSDEEISSAAIAWDTQKHLKFDVPFIDMKPSIYLDPFLPQVVKLAKQSSDRQTKVAACELLHSLVLYALGRGAQMPGETQKKYPMEQLYRKLFPSLLQLACDVELVCKELFEPLMLQLIHWFTNNKMAESPETMALLDCIFDGLIQSNDMALRDFCAKCLREFLKWSLKQISKKSAEKNPINVKSVLKRIYSFSAHPNASKRLGAALAFNNIYMVLREEDALVDRFTFEILVHFVDSLSLAHYDEKSLGTQEQCVKALEHLERIMKTKVDILKKDPGPKIRPEPSSWNSRKLEFAVRWLTRQCGNPQTECRHSCMKLVYNLCVLLPGIKTPSAFFAILHKSEGPIYFLRRFEGGGQGYSESHGILAHPTMIEYRKTFSLEVAREWFDLLLAALDCYCWLFGQELMIPSQIFKGKESERSCIFVSLEFFLKRLAFNDIAAASRLFSHRDNFTFTPREIEEYNRMKCTVIIRFWNFMSILIAKFSKELKEIVPSSLWCYQLWRLLCYCVIKPSTLGFNMSDTEIMLNLPKEMKSCLQTLSKFLPSDILIQFKNALKQELSGECDLVTMLPINLMSPATNYTHLSLMLEGYRQLHTAGLLIDHLPKLDISDKQCLAVQLLNNVFQGIVDHQDGELSLVTLTPSALSLAKTLLILSLELHVPISDLVEKLLDKTQVQGLSGGVKVNHGDHFLTLMSSTIAGSVVGKVPEILEMFVKKTSMLDTTCVGAFLVAVLDHVAKDRMLRKNVGVKLCQAILGFLNQQKSCLEGESSADNQRLLLLILTKLFLIDGQIAKDSSSETFQSLSDMYQCILKDPKTNMAIKNEALVLLPFFVTAKSQQDKYLKETLDRFIVDNFPLTSTEFEPGTSKYKDYITAIDRILVAMEMTGSLMVLNIVISVYCRETEHIHSEAIQLGINRFVQRLPLDQQLLAMDVPFSVFVNDNSYLPHVRRAAVENVCLPILRVVSTSALVQFFSSHIQEIIRYLDQTLNKNVESALENQLSTKIGCFQLLEIMYARLSKEEVNSQTSVINQKLCEGKVDTGKEMTQKITKCAHEARSEDVRGETLLPDLRRQYHCFAYNLLIAIISCVQTDLKFYKGFLFQDNISKGQFLLENLVDTNKKYEFTVEVKSPVQRHKKFVSIRNIAHEMRAESNGQDESASPSLHLASQYLADSSLNDDLNQFDFNMSSNWQSELYDPITTSDRSTKGGHSASQENKVTTEEPSSQDYIELEMDALNRHESMASLIAVIKHMSIAKITPEVSPGNLPTEMPSWMSYLHEKMSAAFSAVNVRLFICKLVMNCSQIFQPYAKFWLKPFGQLLLEKTVCGEGLTYFAVDIIITMITWHKSAIPADTTDERALASRIVRLVSDNIYHPVRQIYRNNLTLLKSLLEVWHDRVDIPYDTIYNLLKNTDPKSMKSTTGIQILGVVLAGKFPPYGPVAPVDRDRYLSSLCVLMSNCYKAVHAAAAEVIGLAMKWLEKNCKETEGPFHDSAIAQLTSLSNNNLGIFITCLHCIHLSYPPLCFKFQSKLLYVLPKLHGHFKVQCLELLLGQVDEMENVYLQLKGLSEYLIHRSEDVQLVALKIVHAVMTRLKGSELLSFLKVGTTFSGHPNPACRKIMLEIFMWSYDNYKDMEDEDSATIISLTKEALLRGLCDEDFACRLVCLNFWSSNTRLPEGTLERTISMLEAMYSPNTEPHYLAYATNLLLEATSKSPDYQREIFEHALSECTFQDYSVHSSWRQRHAVMTPLFASTFATQSMETGQDSLDGGLRATQDVPQFTPTMDMTGTARAFNWLTQSSLDTYADPGSSVGASSQLLFNVGSSSQHRNLLIPGQKGEATAKKTFAWKKITLNNIKPAANKDETDGSVQSHEDIWRLRRRFVKDQQAQSLFYIRRNVKINTLREEILKEQKARRENQVTLYRKYRIGDLPDIQIKYQYIIAPLQALAHRDSTVARLLFSSLFQAIFCEMDKLKTETEIEQLIQQINDSISHILRQSLYFFPPFLGSILTILYELRSSLKVSASDVGTSSITSNQQSLGIMVLEENLIKSDSTEVANRSKKSRQTRSLPSPELAEWIQLSRLYKSANEFDIVQGIFSDQLGTKDQTRKAIEAEARGDFKTANLIYSQIIAQQDWKDGDPLEAEVDFWDISRMECLDHLSQWKDLETISVKGVDSSDQPNLDRVWDDGFYQEQYLPYVIRSKLKLLLSGDANQQSLLTFVDNCMTDLQKKQHLENRYCSELALMSLWQQSYDRSRHYCNMAFRGFLQDWCNTATLMVSSCRKNLQQLQSLVELKEFLDSVGPDRNCRKNLQQLQSLVELKEFLDSVGPDRNCRKNLQQLQSLVELKEFLDSVGPDRNCRKNLQQLQSLVELKEFLDSVGPDRNCRKNLQQLQSLVELKEFLDSVGPDRNCRKNLQQLQSLVELKEFLDSVGPDRNCRKNLQQLQSLVELKEFLDSVGPDRNCRKNLQQLQSLVELKEFLDSVGPDRNCRKNLQQLQSLVELKEFLDSVGPDRNCRKNLQQLQSLVELKEFLDSVGPDRNCRKNLQQLQSLVELKEFLDSVGPDRNCRKNLQQLQSLVELKEFLDSVGPDRNCRKNLQQLQSLVELKEFLDSVGPDRNCRKNLQQLQSLVELKEFLDSVGPDRNCRKNLQQLQSLVELKEFLDSVGPDLERQSYLVSSCRKNLQQLQSLVELKEFLDSVGPDHKVLPSASTLLINAWKGRLPHKLLDPVPVWDDVTHNRVAYINLILDQLSGDSSDPDTNINHTITELHKAKASLRLAMADCCQTQNNYTLSLRLLRDTQTVCKNSDQELFLKWSHLYTAAHQSSAKSKGHPWTDDIFSKIATTLELLKKLEEYAILLERSDLRLEHQILTGEGYGLLAQGVLEFNNSPDLQQGTLKKCYSLATPEGMEVSKDKMFCQLVDKGYNYLKAAVCQDMDEQLNEKKRQAITMEEANLRLAKFCDKYLILGNEMKRFPKECDRTLFPETIVLCLLNAMKGGSEEARERFPRLLQLSELFPDVWDVFIKKAAEVPSWMFLMWTSQMTALMDKDESVVVSPLLERIAQDYPQALIYPLHMSSEGFDFTPKSESKIEKYQLNKRKETLDRLNGKIHNVLVYKFISALEQFGQPDIIFKDWCSDMKRLLGNDKSSKDQVRRKCQEIYDQLLNVKGDTTASSTQINYSATAASVGMGEFRKGFSDNFKAEFEKVFGKDGCKLISMNAKDFQGAEACLRNLIDGKRGLFNPPTKLKAYSPWLAEFNPNKFGKDLEIPGQYTGQQKPTPEYHVKIAGFDERVLVMSSLRKPKRILIRGNDEQDYPYLVKSGEDLRLDQRIEMLFFMMNKVMNSDWACKQRKLQLKTYQVVSMTPRVGLIEWMRDTCPLKNFLYNALTEDERKFLDSERGPSKVYNQWICKLVNKAQYGHWQKIFDEVYIKYNYTETIKQFRLLEGTVPWDLSRRALHSMSSSPEAFHVLKSAMIKSHAVICICQYLLGIGDRHLSNFMVDLKTGQLIGIDFGHAFGSATEFLPVPELMPFRLTRQLINLSLPLKVKGQMESTMRHVLRALRADSDLLLRTMDVFVKEPHLDWLNFAERQKDESADAECENAWYPEKKIIIARRKLKGDHPSYIMMQELESVKAKREKVYTYICGVLKGQKDENVRFSFQAHDLTVEEQVAALIDQATDPNILGRTWTGWEPWF
ncbi:DNA-dependent protein kinase catalytic subunit-like [Biomphalaria glabrata]|uniref:DNA-dependent protein kinase catalytic subunit n=1 Tax=Biomphalaria glabrata TaxID=6526 RepID=A0A9W2ZHY2_BIOGL|nr:DNA-dependent protein kinase catalytic subunit-like [Biomphalaria glabrata]